MYSGWTKKEIKEAWQRFYRIYRKNPVDYRFLCGHCIQSEDDMASLDYYIIGTWLVVHRQYRSWSKEKTFDLALIVEFMQAYKITVPRYVKKTKFYRKKMKPLLSMLNTKEVSMKINFKEFQKELAEYKVYDAWQYVNSLQEMLAYMDMSCALVENVYLQRKEIIREKEQEIVHEAIEKGSVDVCKSTLPCTGLNIAGVKIDDRLFLQKTTMEFFHYARMSIDILFQIINAALLGDRAVEVGHEIIIRKVCDIISEKPEFEKLNELVKNNKENENFKYIQAFDNYMKHIKTVLVAIQNSFIIGNKDTFLIGEFVNKGIRYPERDAVPTIRELDHYVKTTVLEILTEVKNQLPNCLDNSHRIHDISFKFVAKKVNDGIYPEYLSFFIEVQENIDELPSEVKIRPLIVKPNGSIAEFDFKFDKIFIKKKGTDEDEVIGCAEIKNGFDTNEFYRVFTVRSCGRDEYIKYVGSFKKKYPRGKFNTQAMHGEIIVDPE